METDLCLTIKGPAFGHCCWPQRDQTIHLTMRSSANSISCVIGVFSHKTHVIVGMLQEWGSQCINSIALDPGDAMGETTSVMAMHDTTGDKSKPNSCYQMTSASSIAFVKDWRVTQVAPSFKTDLTNWIDIMLLRQMIADKKAFILEFISTSSDFP